MSSQAETSLYKNWNRLRYSLEQDIATQEHWISNKYYQQAGF